MNRKKFQPPQTKRPPWKEKLYEIIFEADTPLGKLFDVVLLILILISVVSICLESVFVDQSNSISEEAVRYVRYFFILEWILTSLFTIEYIARIVCARKPLRYMTSFFGIVDLLSILPTWLAALVARNSSFAVLRALRLLRVFRVLKLVWLLGEANELGQSVWNARGKIIVFLVVISISVTIAGAAMYELEPNNFGSIPESMYWAVVTMTTVGYGDVTPETPLGKFCASLLILFGYSLIIVPTGFVSAEMVHTRLMGQKEVTTRVCSECMSEGHDPDATYCKYCSHPL